MKRTLQIVFHGMEHSDAVEQAVRRKYEHLERFASDITRISTSRCVTRSTT